MVWNNSGVTVKVNHAATEARACSNLTALGRRIEDMPTGNLSFRCSWECLCFLGFRTRSMWIHESRHTGTTVTVTAQALDSGVF